MAEEGTEGTEGKEGSNELAEAKASLAKATTDMEAMKADLTARDSALAQANKDVEAARTYVQQVVTQLQTTAGNEGKAADERPFEERFSENPEGVIDEMFRSRVAPVYNEYLQSQSQSNRALAKQQLQGKDWDEHEEAVVKLMDQQTPDVRAKFDNWEKALDMIRGSQLEKITEKKVTKKIEDEKKAATERASPPAPRGKGGVDSLTEDERTMAGKFGLTPEQFAKAKDEHEEAGGFFRPGKGAA